MRGKTVKILRKFAKHLIANTPEGQVEKTPRQLVQELKVHWKTKGKMGQKFIKDVLGGKLKNESSSN